MRGKIKITTAFFIMLVMVTCVFVPAIKVFAEGESTYTVTFTVTEGEHELEISGDTDLGINGNYLAL